MAKTVLLVEDDASLRACLAELLSLEGGFTVRTAENGQDALAQIDGGLAFDALLTDRRMPLMGGEQLLKEVRARGLKQLTVLMTGDIIVPDHIDGADMVVRKPMSIIELIDDLNARL